MKKSIFFLSLIFLAAAMPNSNLSSNETKFEENILIAYLLPWSPDISTWFAERYAFWTKSTYLKYCIKCDKAQRVGVPKEKYINAPGFDWILFRCWKCGYPSKNQKNLYRKHGYPVIDEAYQNNTKKQYQIKGIKPQRKPWTHF